MRDPRIPRISEQAREARRPLPVSTLLSARQETIHRDPGAARAARSVKVSDKLPDEVEEALRNCDIYGDDAHGVQTPRASLRLSIAKAIRDAEERMRGAAEKLRKDLANKTWTWRHVVTPCACCEEARAFFATLVYDDRMRSKIASYASELVNSRDPEESATKREIGLQIEALLKEFP